MGMRVPKRHARCLLFQSMHCTLIESKSRLKVKKAPNGAYLLLGAEGGMCLYERKK